MAINAQTGSESNPPTFTFAPTGTQLDWAQFLRAWAAEVARQQSDECGAWIFAALHAAADEAVVWGCATPQDHDRQRETIERLDQAYLHELECRAHAAEAEDPGDPNAPDICGSLLGPDEHVMRAWLSCDPDGETFCN